VIVNRQHMLPYSPQRSGRYVASVGGSCGDGPTALAGSQPIIVCFGNGPTLSGMPRGNPTADGCIERIVSCKRRNRDGSDEVWSVKKSGKPLIIVGAIIILD